MQSPDRAFHHVSPAPPGPPARLPTAFVLLLVLFLIAGALLDAAFSLGMVFATDGCGTDGPAGSARICNGAVWGATLLLPWVGWFFAALVGFLGGRQARRSNRSAWLAFPLALAIYLLFGAISAALVFA
jgi:hypothetical protein